MSLDLTRITNSVTSMNDVGDGVIAFITDIAQKLRDALAQPDPQATDALNALADGLDAKKQQISDAITANTPVA